MKECDNEKDIFYNGEENSRYYSRKIEEADGNFAWELTTLILQMMKLNIVYINSQNFISIGSFRKT
jgi:hypothetical protein